MSYVSPGDTRYTCYKYPIYVSGFLLDLITKGMDVEVLVKITDRGFKIDGEPVTGLPGDSRTVCVRDAGSKYANWTPCSLKSVSLSVCWSVCLDYIKITAKNHYRPRSFSEAGR